MISIQVRQKTKLPVDKSLLLRAAQHTLEATNSNIESDLGIVIGDDALLKRLNLKYRGEDNPTDVLSFPSGEIDPDTKSLYLGDVVISLPRAEDQACAGHHPLKDELQLLVIHGTLHLLGYDHLERTDKKKMQSAQDNILDQLDIMLVSKL
jgi:probable rRNA maturation factor